MSQNIGRRKFIQGTTATGLAVGIRALSHNSAAAQERADQVVIGVMGLNRGRALANAFARRSDVQIRYVCDVDRTRVDACQAELSQSGHTRVQGVIDFRRILDDPQIDALVCAAPNHWHAPATILACQAGKHVYVEKPCSHNPREGEMMVQAARQYDRAVQLGTQRRSGEGTIQAIEQLREGAIGRVYLARCWYSNLRGSIGKGKPSQVPEQLNYELWQGPAPRLPYQDNVVHYNWHWRWHWGNGELGNNGVHTIDLCRWGLNVEYPTHVTSSGGRYAYDDDQETPDTQTVCFDFPDQRTITWQGLSCNKHGDGFVVFYGTEGALALEANGSYRIYDRGDKLRHEHSHSDSSEASHIQNFLSAIRSGKHLELNAEIAEGHKSTLLCHLGNISHRAGRSLMCDPSNGHIRDDDSAMQFWRREYAPGWEPKI